MKPGKDLSKGGDKKRPDLHFSKLILVAAARVGWRVLGLEKGNQIGSCQIGDSRYETGPQMIEVLGLGDEINHWVGATGRTARMIWLLVKVVELIVGPFAEIENTEEKLGLRGMSRHDEFSFWYRGWHCNWLPNIYAAPLPPVTQMKSEEFTPDPGWTQSYNPTIISPSHNNPPCQWLVWSIGLS